jgi:endonuclease III
MQNTSQRLQTIVAVLHAAYPDATVGLVFSSPFELLIATILSAQCTDERVNMVTPALFRRFPTPQDVVCAQPEEIEQYIYSTGFYKNKARNILLCCKRLVDVYDSVVPNTLDELITLAGVGRKTANCVLSSCFDIPGITVDTHVMRLSNRFGVAEGTNAVQIEQRLMSLLPKNLWNTMNHALIWHGRTICKARNPECPRCPVSHMCPSSTV